MENSNVEVLEQKCLLLMNKLSELENKFESKVLDRDDLNVLYHKIEAKDKLIKELEDEIENLKVGNDIEFEPVNDDSNAVIALNSELESKNSEIAELNNKISEFECMLADARKQCDELEASVEKLEQQAKEAEGSKESELAELKAEVEGFEGVKAELTSCKEEIGSLKNVVAEKDEAIAECNKVIETKSALVREKVEELEAFKIEFGSIQELKNELADEKRKNEELLESQQEFEEAINDYECRLSSAGNEEQEKNTEEVDLNDVFPIIDDNTVLNARKLCYIREVGDNPWLEDIVCYLSAKTKGDLQNTGIEPYFIILDDLKSDIRVRKYNDYAFTLNALPSFGPAPESNITVTSYDCVPDLKAYLNISNHEFIVFVDRYGKNKPFVKRKGVTEYNLVNNAELADLCKLRKDDSLIATFDAKQLVNGLEIPYDFALRGKRDRISLFLSKHAYEEVLENLKSGLFK